MRELKFRAWNEELKRIISFEDLSEFPLSELKNDKVWTFEQYTGLTDKNGKEIYEGDIVKCYFYGRMIGIYQVIWNEDIAGFEMEAIKGNPKNDNIKDIRSFAEMHLFTRIIGNIHENPELLEGEK